MTELGPNGETNDFFEFCRRIRKEADLNRDAWGLPWTAETTAGMMVRMKNQELIDPDGLGRALRALHGICRDEGTPFD